MLDLLPLAGAQQAVVNEDAGEPVPDGPVDEGGGHGGVDAAGQAADDVGLADPLADGGDLLVDDGAGGPRRRDAGAVVQEVGQDGQPVLGVEDLGMPLEAEQAARAVLEGGDGGLVR